MIGFVITVVFGCMVYTESEHEAVYSGVSCSMVYTESEHEAVYSGVSCFISLFAYYQNMFIYTVLSTCMPPYHAARECSVYYQIYLL